MFATSNTERMRLDTSGRLLVGTTSTSAASTAVFQGNSTVNTGNAVLRLQRGDASPSSDSPLGGVYYGDNTGSYSAAIVAERDGGTWSSSSLPTRLAFTLLRMVRQVRLSE